MTYEILIWAHLAHHFEQYVAKKHQYQVAITKPVILVILLKVVQVHIHHRELLATVHILCYLLKDDFARRKSRQWI